MPRSPRVGPADPGIEATVLGLGGALFRRYVGLAPTFCGPRIALTVWRITGKIDVAFGSSIWAAGGFLPALDDDLLRRDGQPE